MSLMRTPTFPTLSLSVAVAAVVLSLATHARADEGGWFPSDAPAATEDAAAPEAADAAPLGDNYADDDPSALTDFRSQLSPYGTWTEDPNYGTLWVPDASQVGGDFAPYQSAGSWGTTAGGDWLWQSEYPWGYIPFHYGRWLWTGSAWGWVPGRTYAPAWVAWRTGQNGYVGWAPLPPAWGWRAGRAYAYATVPRAAFGFVPVNYAFLPGVSAYMVRDRGMIGSIAASTHPYRSTGYAAGRMGPTLSEAHIPASAAPRSVGRPDGRSISLATRSGTAAVRAAGGLGGAGRGFAMQARGEQSFGRSEGSFSRGGGGYSHGGEFTYVSGGHVVPAGGRGWASHAGSAALHTPYRPPSYGGVSHATAHGGHVSSGHRR